MYVYRRRSRLILMLKHRPTEGRVDRLFVDKGVLGSRLLSAELASTDRFGLEPLIDVSARLCFGRHSRILTLRRRSTAPQDPVGLHHGEVVVDGDANTRSRRIRTRRSTPMVNSGRTNTESNTKASAR